MQMVLLSQKVRGESPSRLKITTYRFQATASQDPLCRRRNTTPIALQVPHNITSA